MFIMSSCFKLYPSCTVGLKEEFESLSPARSSSAGGDPHPSRTLSPPPLSTAIDRGAGPMDSVPDAIVQQILSQLNNARDIASIRCISKQWKDCIPFIPSLFFPRSSFDSIPGSDADAAITRMISLASRLEELIIYCPFFVSSLQSWLSLRSQTLRILELRMDPNMDSDDKPGTRNALDCIGLVKRLEVLKLWGVSMTKAPNWGDFMKLHTLEIVGAALNDDALSVALKACPNLTDLALLGCDGVESVVIEMESLERCRLDFLGPGASLIIRSPRIRVLDVQGFSWIHVDKNHRLERLSIGKNSGRVYRVDIGRLAALEYLCIRGVQWAWNAIESLLRCASEVKHLIMKIEFCGDYDALQPFPEIDLVEFFNGHQKLRSFEIHGAMFAALCQKNSLKNLDWRFNIPCLEEVLVTVRSPLNAEQKLNTLESLVKYSEKLRKLVIRISGMKGVHDAADAFFKEICRLQIMNQRTVYIE